MENDLRTSLCLWGLLIIAGAGAILGKVFLVPELTTACVGLFAAGLGYYLRGSRGGSITGLLAVGALGASLGLGGCATTSAESLPAKCAVQAAAAAVREFASCCLSDGSTARCTDPTEEE